MKNPGATKGQMISLSTMCNDDVTAAEITAHFCSFKFQNISDFQLSFKFPVHDKNI